MGSTISKKMAETPTEGGTPKLTGSLRKFGRKLLGSRSALLDRRYTPYRKTPKSARISSIPSLGENRNKRTSSRDVDQAVDNNIGGSDLTASSDEVKNLVGKTWRVYSASPLYDFKYNAASLKSYEKSLSAYLEVEVGKVELLTDSNSGNFKVEFKTIEELTMSDSDSPAVEINITPKQKGRKSNNPILTALFCSLGNEAFKDAEPKMREKFTSLPVCLIKGSAALTRCFISGLEAQFDFKICAMNFSSLDLAWFVSLWVGVVLQEYSRPVELCYCIPASAKGLNKILYSIKAKDAKAIWDCVHERGSPVFTEGESATFIKALETHFYHHFKVDLSRIPLSRVGTSIVLVGSEGRIKLLHPSYVKHILQQITAVVNEAYGRL